MFVVLDYGETDTICDYFVCPCMEQLEVEEVV